MVSASVGRKAAVGMIALAALVVIFSLSSNSGGSSVVLVRNKSSERISLQLLGGPSVDLATPQKPVLTPPTAFLPPSSSEELLNQRRAPTRLLQQQQTSPKESRLQEEPGGKGKSALASSETTIMFNNRHLHRGSIEIATTQLLKGWYCHKNIPGNDIRIHIRLVNPTISSSSTSTTTTMTTPSALASSLNGSRSSSSTLPSAPPPNDFGTVFELDPSDDELVAHRHPELCSPRSSFTHVFPSNLAKQGARFTLGVSSAKGHPFSAKHQHQTIWEFPDYGWSKNILKAVPAPTEAVHFEETLRAGEDRWREDKELQKSIGFEGATTTKENDATEDVYSWLDQEEEEPVQSVNDSSSLTAPAVCRLHFYDIHSGEKVVGPATTFMNEKYRKYHFSSEWPFQRKVECDSGQHAVEGHQDETSRATSNPRNMSRNLEEGSKKKKKKKKKGRALVMYMISGVWNPTSDPAPPPHLQPHQQPLQKINDEPTRNGNKELESDNVDFFLQFGYLETNLSTALFDGIDFVVYRRSRQVTAVTLCSQPTPNLKLLLVPMNGRCDLCAHARVLTYLNYESRMESGKWLYRSVVMLNSGTRGPFLSEAELKGLHNHRETEGANDEQSAAAGAATTWVDIASMTQHQSRPQYLRDEIQQFYTTVNGVHFNALSHERTLHLQSYFLVIPISSLPFYYKLFNVGGCWSFFLAEGVPVLPADSKFHCVYAGEVGAFDFLDKKYNGLKPLLQQGRRRGSSSSGEKNISTRSSTTTSSNMDDGNGTGDDGTPLLNAHHSFDFFDISSSQTYHLGKRELPFMQALGRHRVSFDYFRPIFHKFGGEALLKKMERDFVSFLTRRIRLKASLLGARNIQHHSESVAVQEALLSVEGFTSVYINGSIRQCKMWQSEKVS